MKIYTDSGTKEFCYVIEPDVGLPIVKVEGYRHPVTCNAGEYKAIIQALEFANSQGEHGWHDFEILTDSQLVANQLNGTAKVKSPHLIPYYAHALALKNKLNVKVTWLEREKNLAGKILE